MRLQQRSFRFDLCQPLQTAAGVLEERRGWLLRLEDGNGRLGWGEVAPLAADQLALCSAQLERLRQVSCRHQLEALLPGSPPALAFGLGAALAELDGLLGSPAQPWLNSPPPAWLLPSGEKMCGVLEAVLAQHDEQSALTFKWKVASGEDAHERRLLVQLLERLPATCRLRLDANGGWDRATAHSWMGVLAGDPRFAWLEQPLAVADQEGLRALARLGPVALDESLDHDPTLRQSWPGWQVRRPSQEGDPRPLLRELKAGWPWRMLSTAFETGIGRRWLNHLAALQWQGPTPAAPGFAPGWCPDGDLFGADPAEVWGAAA
jgi:O-succinylbenzoate synthase